MKKFLFFFLILLNINLFSKNSGWVNSIQGLNLRASADLNSKVITIIPESEIVQILIVDKTKKYIINGLEDYWMNIKYKNNNGWVFGSYISDVKILTENEYKNVSDDLLKKIDSEKNTIKTFFKQKLTQVEHYKYEILNDLPSKVQIFVEIMRFDDTHYEEEIKYDFSKWQYNYKVMYNEFNDSIKNNQINIKNRFFIYSPKDLSLSNIGKLKFISYDGFYQYNFSKNLIYFKKKSALIVTIMYYYDNDKIRNNLVYYNQKSGKYIYKDEGLRYNKILEDIFLKVVSIVNIY